MSNIIRLNELPEGSDSLTGDDIFVFMDDPSGSGITKKISLTQISNAIGGGGNPFDQNLNTTDFPTFSGVNLSNNSSLATGSFDSGIGGNGGISLNCVVGYELNWQAGHLRNIVTGDNTGTPQTIYSDSSLQFPGSGLNYMTIDNNGFTFPDGSTQTSAAIGDTNTYIICKTGDDLAAKYSATKALTPGGNALSATNRSVLIVMPGVYPLSAQLEIDGEFVDIIGLGSSSNNPGCSVAVTLTGYDINVSANNVRIKGIGVPDDRAFKVDGDKPLQIFEECRGGYYTDGSNAFSSFGGVGTASGTFTNCVGGIGSFGGDGGTASGSFSNCIGDDYSFGGGGTANGSFTNCSGGNWSLGGSGGTASGSFNHCSGGSSSFGGYGTASGLFINCVGTDNSFGGGDGLASGTFLRCTLTVGTFPVLTGSGKIRLCIDGNHDVVNADVPTP